MCGSDRYRRANDCDADVLALAEPDDGSHATAGSGYAYRMGVSTKRIRRMQPAHATYVHIHISLATHGDGPEYSQGTARGKLAGRLILAPARC